MIKGNIILAVNSGSQIKQVNTVDAVTTDIRMNNLDLYWIIATEDATVVTSTGKSMKIKKGQFLIKSYCHEFYYVCNGKVSIQDFYNAYLENDRIREERNKANRSSEGCVSEFCGEVPTRPSNQ